MSRVGILVHPTSHRLSKNMKRSTIRCTYLRFLAFVPLLRLIDFLTPLELLELRGRAVTVAFFGLCGFLVLDFLSAPSCRPLSMAFDIVPFPCIKT